MMIIKWKKKTLLNDTVAISLLQRCNERGSMPKLSEELERRWEEYMYDTL